jgi:hypothetical protein
VIDPSATQTLLIELNDAMARKLGAKYGQVAVFRITAERLFVLACRDVSMVSRAH